MTANQEKKKLTVLIPAFNVEKIIGRCINSVSWADEIFIVDSFSSDKTAAIAEKMGVRVIKHQYDYSAKQKNWAIPQASNDWILLIDSDEEATPELRDEIKTLLESDEIEKYDGFAIGRRHYFLNQWLRWGGRYPLYNIRLFRKSCRYEDRDVHAHIILPKDRVNKLKYDIIHYSDPTLEHFFEKFNRYTTYQANYMMKISGHEYKMEWKKFFTYYIYTKSVIKDFWYFLPLTPVLRFIYVYILRLGFLDGKYGFLLAMLYSFHDYVSRTKYLELKGKQPKVRFMIQRFVKNIIPKHGGRNEIVDRIYSEDLLKAKM